MQTNNVEADTFIAFKAMRYARRELCRAIRYAEANPTEEAKLKRTDALATLNEAKRRYEELAIMRDVVWQQNIKRYEQHKTIKVRPAQAESARSAISQEQHRRP